MIDLLHPNPARAWRTASLNQTPEHQATIKQVLGVSHSYAAAPFVLVELRHGKALAAALNPPPLLHAEALRQWDDEPDTDIILIDGNSGAVRLVGDPGGSWVLGMSPHQPEIRLFTDGRAFAREWARNRQDHIDRFRAARVPGLVATDALHGGLPGYVVAGQLDRVTHWTAILSAQRVLIDTPSLVGPLRSALIRASGVPTVEAFKPNAWREAA